MKNVKKQKAKSHFWLFISSLKFVIHETVRSDDEKDQITPRYGGVMIL